MPIGSALTLDYPTALDNMATVVAKIKTILQTYEALFEATVDVGSLDLTGPLSVGGSYLYNLIRLVLSDVTDAPTDNGSLYTDADGNLHIVTPDGDVKLTLNGQINATSTGAFTGDYGAGPETAYYDQVSGEYRFFTDTSPETWATLIAKAFKAVKDSGASGSAKFGVDASVSTDLVFELKTLPGSGVGGLAYEASSNGVVDASVTRETLTHKFTGIDLTGNVQLTTGKVNHTGTRYKFIPLIGVFTGSGTGAFSESSGAVTYTLDTSGGKLTIPTGLLPGDKITKVRVAYTTPGGDPYVKQYWTTFGSAYEVAMTQGATNSEFSVKVTDYTPDTAEAIALHENAGDSSLLFAYGANIRIQANAATVLHGVSIEYTSEDIVHY